MPHSGDFLHQCDIGAAPTVARKDDVLRLGDNTDADGTTTTAAPVIPLLQGVENKLGGTVSDLAGEQLDEETVRGNRASTTFQRSHVEYIE